MPISFNNIPSNWRQPLYWVEIDSSMAGQPIYALPALLVGQMLSTGTATADVPVPCQSPSLADSLFGQGSHLAAVARAFFKVNASQECWCLPVADPTGSQATGTITVATPPTQAGILDLYIGGKHIQVFVAADDTIDDVAININAGINANVSGDLCVTSTVTAAAVTVKAKFKGIVGDDITMLDTYYNGPGGEQLPQGLTLTYSGATLTGGAGTPLFDNAIANMGEMAAEFVCLPFTDSTTLLAWETEFGFTDSGRWGWMRQLFGSIWSAKRDTYATRNCPQTSILSIEQASPSPVWEWAAAYTGKAARGFTDDPARPLQTLQLTGILPAPLHQRFIMSELNSLALTGMGTQRTVAGNTPMISRETTTYQLNSYGFEDIAYTDATTLATLAKLLRNQRAAVTNKWPRHKIADDGTLFGPGQAIVTPKSIAAELVAQYRIDEFNGLVEDVDTFVNNLIVERDSTDPTRVNVLYPPNLISGLRMFAVLAQFRLMSDEMVGINSTAAAQQIALA